MAKLIKWKSYPESPCTRIDTDSDKIATILTDLCTGKLVATSIKLNTAITIWTIELPDILVDKAINTLKQLRDKGVDLG